MPTLEDAIKDLARRNPEARKQMEWEGMKFDKPKGGKRDIELTRDDRGAIVETNGKPVERNDAGLITRVRF